MINPQRTPREHCGHDRGTLEKRENSRRANPRSRRARRRSKRGMIGEHLRQARRLRGMTQTKLAQLIAKSGSQVSQIEHEAAGTSIHTALAASQALNVSMDYLVGRVNDATG